MELDEPDDSAVDHSAVDEELDDSAVDEV